MPTFTAVFLIMLALATGVELYLAWRQMKHVQAHRAAVPAPFAERISLAEHQKAADYTTTKLRVGFAEGVYGVILLLAWTLGGGLDWLDQLWRGFEFGPIWTGVGFMVSLMLIAGMLELPFTLYNTFEVEQRFGFNKVTPGLFISDLLKHTALMLALGVPLAALVLWLMADAGTYWWAWVWAVWMGFSLLMLWAYPAFIAPLFNKFTPLEDEALNQRITGLLARCGFKSQGVFVMDGSRRSSHGNAYFTGMGNNKRIVFFDTLLKGLEHDEVEAVLAHELGHFRRHHVRKRFIVMAISSLIGLAVLGWLIDQPWFYHGLGVSQPSVHAALVLFMLVSPVFTFFMGPLMARSSRKHEFEADDFAAEQTNPRYLISGLVKLYKDNASTLTPDAWYSAFHDSHPPAPVRVAHLSAKLG